MSLDRVNEFLRKVCSFYSHDTDITDTMLAQTELLDEFEEQKVGQNATVKFVRASHDENVLAIGHTKFTWAVEDGAVTPATPATPGTSASGTRSQRKFVLNVEDQLVFKPGRINLIVGPTGSGKTSLLMALLG